MVFYMGLGRKKIIYGFSIVIFLSISFYIVHHAGSFLVLDDQPDNTDIMVVLMGSTGDRMLQAYDLYSAGISDKVLLVNTFVAGNDILAERGVHLKSNTEIAKEIGVALGIEPNALIIIPGSAQSTREEADAVRNYIQSNENISNILLISSSYHTRRARLIFNRAFSRLESPVDVYVKPSEYSGFNHRQWYRERESAKRVMMEYTRLIHFLLRDRWRI